MKKHYIVGVLLATGMLTGCWKSEPPALEDRIDQNENTEITYEGVVGATQTDARQAGTHALSMGSQSILIQSRTINLNDYLNKEVSVTGIQEKGLGNSEPVLNVTEIRLLKEDFTQVTEYENESDQFRLSYPQGWELRKEDRKITFLRGEETLGTVSSFDDVENLDTFVSARELEKGEAVTVAAQPSLRFNDSASLRLYIPLPPQKKAYIVSFSQESLREKAVKDAFYQLLDSFELIYSSSSSSAPESTEKCGGPEQLKCPEGYLCELSSGEQNAEGACVSQTASDGQKSCAYIAPPVNCALYHVAQYNAAGCPISYECQQAATAPAAEEPAAPETEEDEPAAPEVSQPEAEPEESEEPAAPAQEPEEEEGSEEEEDSEEEEGSASAENEEAEEKEYAIPSADSVTAVYEVNQRAFSFGYPKSWYFWSFGPLSGTNWTVGLANAEMEDTDDAVITVSIVEKGKSAIGGEYKAKKSRDASTEYVVEGPSDLKAVMDAILASIQAIETETESETDNE